MVLLFKARASSATNLSTLAALFLKGKSSCLDLSRICSFLSSNSIFCEQTEGQHPNLQECLLPFRDLHATSLKRWSVSKISLPKRIASSRLYAIMSLICCENFAFICLLLFFRDAM